MHSIAIEFRGCPTCGLVSDCARGGVALHPIEGPAIVTCFHGPVQLTELCRCTVKPLFVEGRSARVLCTVERRDVAWLFADISGLPPAMPLATVIPSAGDTVVAQLSIGAINITVSAVTGRDVAADPPFELALASTFRQGESGSPVVNTAGSVAAVVRNTGGRCGLVLPHPNGP